MNGEYINLTEENLEEEMLCCILIKAKTNLGVENKRKWLKERLSEGHVYRKLNKKATVFIEYAPLEKAWTPILGENYLYLYCLWVEPAYKGKGYGKALLEYCIADAKEKGKSGICMLGSNKQKSWLSDQSFVKKFGFECVEQTDYGYELLALSFDGSKPRFSENAKIGEIEQKELTIFYDDQCPFTLKYVEYVRKFCEKADKPVFFEKVDSLEKAKKLPCVFNNWAVFYDGKFRTVNLMSESALKSLFKKA